MTTKEFDGFHNGVQEATDIIWWLQTLSRAYRVLHQHELAEEVLDASNMLRQAVEKIKVGYSHEINSRFKDAEQHSHTLLATLLHASEIGKNEASK